MYSGSYVFAAWLIIVSWNLLRRGWTALGRLFLLGFWLFVWARWMEPQAIRIQEREVSANFEQKIVLVADTHLGVYKDEQYLRRVVDSINQIPDIDMVLIAGDLSYVPRRDQRLEVLLSPWAESKVPVFAVLGNHDVEKP
ncbi:MAG: metallophosphoesterase [Candidatus Peribacteria bacterium]|nr:MAG: metallophosphoesterase [Candidatus Peribacteria bacterium]